MPELDVNAKFQRQKVHKTFTDDWDGITGNYRREALSAETKEVPLSESKVVRFIHSSKVAALAMKSVLSGEPLLHKGCDRLTLLEVQQNHP